MVTSVTSPQVKNLRKYCIHSLLFAFRRRENRTRAFTVIAQYEQCSVLYRNSQSVSYAAFLWARELVNTSSRAVKWRSIDLANSWSWALNSSWVRATPVLHFMIKDGGKCALPLQVVYSWLPSRDHEFTSNEWNTALPPLSKYSPSRGDKISSPGSKA